MRNSGRHEEYKSLKREQRRLFRRKKKRYYKHLIQAISEAPNPWKILRVLLPGTRKKKSTSSKLDPVAKVAKVNELADLYEDLLNDPYTRPITQQLLMVSDGSSIDITKRELKAAIAQSNRNSAGGADQIRYDHIRKITKDDQIMNHILDAMNDWIKVGFPTRAKLAKIYPLQKGLTPESGYRPISLLNCLTKLLERVLTSRLHEHVDDHIPGNQCGCRRRHSTWHCLCRLLNASCTVDDQGQVFGAVFLDFSKAYDRVDHGRLLEMLHSYGVPDALVRAVGLWLSHRTFFVEIDDMRSTTRPMTNGLPQGSSLSVLLWLVYVSDIPTDLESSALFMDDTVIWASAPNMTQLQNKLQATLDDISEWCDTQRIRINGEKCNVLMNTYRERFRLRLVGTTLKPSLSVKYLGVILRVTQYSEGPFEVDLRDVANDLKRRCRVLKPLYRHLPSKEFRLFAEGLILSKLRYYLPVISGESDKTLHPLRIAYRQCLRLMCGGLRTTPLTLLYSQSGLPPLDYLIEEASLRQLMYVTDNPEALVTKEVERYDSQNGSPYEGIVHAATQVPPSIMDSKFEDMMNIPRRHLDTMDDTIFSILPTKEVAAMYLENDKLIPAADWYLFTDGSYMRGSESEPAEAGAGAVLQDSTMTTVKTQGFQVEPACYSYHSEMVALIVGLDMILQMDEITQLPGSQVCVLTDSQSLLTHLEAIPRRVRPYVYVSSMTLVDQIQQLVDHQVKLKYVWIPGHSGIPGNEEADSIAKASTTSDDIWVTDHPINLFRSWIKKHRHSRLVTYLKDNVTPSEINPRAPDRKPFRSPVNSPPVVSGRDRRVDVSLFRLFSGHTNTRDHWRRIGIRDEDPICRYCEQARETAEHLVMECDALWSPDPTRLEILIQAQIDYKGHLMAFPDMLTLRGGSVYNALVKVVEHLVDRGVVL